MGCCESRDKELYIDDLDDLAIALKGSPQHVNDPGLERFYQVFTSATTDNRLISDVFEIDTTRRLGDGASSVVFTGVDRRTKVERAVKQISKKSLTNSQRVALETEVGILRLLDHPHIIKLHEVFNNIKQSEDMYLVMELCTGGELLERIVKTKSGFGEFDAAMYMRQILLAMVYLHKQNIAHRDIKPENLMLKDNSAAVVIKLIDFGIAAKIRPGGSLHTPVGTRLYAAPEIVTGTYNLKIDVWSSGCVLYILLTGRPPYSHAGATRKELQRNIFADIEWRDISPEARDLVSSMLQKNPDRRPEAVDLLQHQWLKTKTPRSPVPLDPKIIDRFRSFNKAKRLKKLCLTMVATQLNEDELWNLRDQFEALDTNGDGTLSQEELAQGMNAVNLNTADLELLMHVDSDGSGGIDWTEFIAAAMDLRHLQARDVCWNAFRKFDTDGDGSITMRDLKTVLSNGTDLMVSDEKAQQLIADADVSGDGTVDFEEFMEMMRYQSTPVTSPSTTCRSPLPSPAMVHRTTRRASTTPTSAYTCTSPAGFNLRTSQGGMRRSTSKDLAAAMAKVRFSNDVTYSN